MAGQALKRTGGWWTKSDVIKIRGHDWRARHLLASKSDSAISPSRPLLSWLGHRWLGGGRIYKRQTRPDASRLSSDGRHIIEPAVARPASLTNTILDIPAPRHRECLWAPSPPMAGYYSLQTRHTGHQPISGSPQKAPVRHRGSSLREFNRNEPMILRLIASTFDARIVTRLRSSGKPGSGVASTTLRGQSRREFRD